MLLTSYFRIASKVFLSSCAVIVVFFYLGLMPALSAPNDIRHTMLKVYNSFKALQSYSWDEEKFKDPKNNDKILTLLHTLSTEFESLAKQHSEGSKSESFQTTLEVVTHSVEEVHDDFKEGNKGIALWELRTVTNQCVTCHSIHSVDVKFHDPSADVSKLSLINQGEFYLATRQFASAEKAFYKAALKPQKKYDRMKALRKWLIIYTRVNPRPEEAIKKLSYVFASTDLIPYNKTEVSEWLTSLKRWAHEDPASAPPLPRAESLLRKSLTMEDPLYASVGTVELLRATSLLHKVLEDKKTNAEQRRKALYLLGLSYAKLRSFFINEMPHIYFEQCIRDYPGTLEAKRSYKVLHEYVMNRYTGSSGTHLPLEQQLRLKELHDAAYGLVTVDGRV